MLDMTYDPNAATDGNMGAQWQIFVQAVEPNRGSTALWMGQNYNSLGPWVPSGNSYDPNGWADEMQRLNYDGDHQFRQGDRVEVTANKTAFYGGKLNINESHRVTPDNDFTVRLLEADYGLPTPEVLTLSDLYASTEAEGYDPAYPMFDASRETGAEHYQGMYVRLNGLTLTDASGWGADAWDERLCVAIDGLGNELTLRMPRIDLGDVPAGSFDVYGIVNQESHSGTNGRMGYGLFVMDVVPEPAGLTVLLLGGLAVLRRRRK
jgi:hypothetical protein